MFGKSVTIIVTTVTILQLLASPSFHSTVQAESVIPSGNNWIAANRGDFTYQASLLTQRSYHYCTGAIISDRWVLTSATCIRNAGFFYNLYEATIKVGGHDVREGHSYICDFVKTHEHYSDTFENDIALTRTSRPILLNKFIQPIPYYKGRSSECQAKNAVSVGWGSVRVTSYLIKQSVRMK